jgi:hypothetical protein
MDIKTNLDAYLGNNPKFTEKDNGDGTKEICNLDNNECFVVRERDGLIERAGQSNTVNRKVRVETNRGIKQLLND